MAATRIRTLNIEDGGVRRDDLNTTTSGQAVVRKILQGTGVTLSSNGVDSGTGDVTINIGQNVGTAANPSFNTLKIGGTTIVDTSRNLVNVGTISGGTINSSGQIRAKGWYTSGDGHALEAGVSGANALVGSYNRSTSTYEPLEIYGSTIAMRIGSIPKLSIDASGNTTVVGDIFNDRLIYPVITKENDDGDRVTWAITIKRYDGGVVASKRYHLKWWFSTSEAGAPGMIAGGQDVTAPYAGYGSNLSAYTATAVNHAVTNSSGIFKIDVSNGNGSSPATLWLNVEIQGIVFSSSANLYTVAA